MWVLVALLLFVAVAALAAGPQIRAHWRALLLVTEEFPQVPVKPLGLLTPPPGHHPLPPDAAEGPAIPSQAGEIAADLVVPGDGAAGGERRRPAIIIAMGVKTAEKDRPLILGFANTLARLGFVTLWPRLAALDQDRNLLEDPDTLVAAFQYLQRLDGVDPQRVSFIGISVGSSIAFVAAADPRIAADVHRVVFFGGYYDALEYLLALAGREAPVNGGRLPWEPAEGAVNHVREIFEEAGAQELQQVLVAGSYMEAERLLAAVPEERLRLLRERSPSQRLSGIRAPVLVLHERSDHYVPYTEALRLRLALDPGQIAAFSVVELLEHVQPRELDLRVIGEALKLEAFVAKALRELE